MNFPWKITSAGENADLDLAQSMLSKSLATRRQTDMILKGIRALGGNKDQIVIERIGPTRQMQAGLERPVFIHNIIARDTIDEVVLERHETKREVQDLLLEACKRRRN